MQAKSHHDWCSDSRCYTILADSIVPQSNLIWILSTEDHPKPSLINCQYSLKSNLNIASAIAARLEIHKIILDRVCGLTDHSHCITTLNVCSIFPTTWSTTEKTSWYQNRHGNIGALIGSQKATYKIFMVGFNFFPLE